VRKCSDSTICYFPSADLFTWSLPSAIDPWPAGLRSFISNRSVQIGKNIRRRSILGDRRRRADITAATAERNDASAKSAATARLKSLTTPSKRREAFRAKPAPWRKTPVQTAGAPRSNRRDAAEDA